MRDVELDRPTALRAANAMWRARGPHVARLVDAADGEDGRLRLRVEDGETPLDEVLAGGLELGEAVAILAPLAAAVETLGAVGVPHGGIDAESVRIDDLGAPVLGGFGSAGDRGAAGDAADFRTLAAAVLAAIADDEPGVARARALLDVLDGEAGSVGAFGERLVGIESPAPVRARSPVERVVRPSPTPPSLLDNLRARLGAVRRRFWAVGAALPVVAAIVVVLLVTDAPEPAAPTAPSGVPAPSTLPTSPPEPPRDPAAAVLELRPEATAAEVIDDYGDVVLLRLTTPSGAEEVVLERTDAGWRLRAGGEAVG